MSTRGIGERQRKTVEEVLDQFRHNGIVVAAWARQHDFDAALVRAILRGQRKCLRGQSHRIAVALGIK